MQFPRIQGQARMSLSPPLTAQCTFFYLHKHTFHVTPVLCLCAGVPRVATPRPLYWRSRPPPCGGSRTFRLSPCRLSFTCQMPLRLEKPATCAGLYRR